MDVLQVYEHYRPDILRVEDVIAGALHSRNATLTESATHLLMAGGKRIRPLFAILCSQLGHPDRDRVTRAGAALELIHMATLVHDDVIDDAPTRRGQPTVRAKYGDRSAMYAGDFLFARAIQLVSSLRTPSVHTEVSNAMVRMCEGEIDQIRDFYVATQTLKQYLRRVEKKTALLISVSCSLGAMVAEAPMEVVHAVRRFGYYTGMAFQIRDDVLDFVGDEAITGKPVGEDLRQGNLTLPTLWALANDSNAEELRALIRPDASGSEVERAVEIVRASAGIDYTRTVTERYMGFATKYLERLPEGTARDQLAAVAGFVNERAY